jgi:hypothetical protein
MGKDFQNLSYSLPLHSQGKKKNNVIQNDTVLGFSLFFNYFFCFFEEKKINLGITQKWVMTYLKLNLMKNQWKLNKYCKNLLNGCWTSYQ